jgi:hypothetical protein
MYAIIAPDIFVDELQPLADWKTKKGVPTIIYNLNGSNSILTTYTARDDAERLHKFLRDLDSTSPALTWLLLAGDAGIIPIRELYVDPNAGLYNIENAYYSDYYYSGLDNNWDFDYDGVYGEGTAEDLPIEADFSPNVYVGRVAVEDEADCTIVVNKILTYEQTPPSGNWLKSAVLWGGLMDAPNDLSTSDGTPAYDPEEDNAYEVKDLKVLPLIPSQMTVTKRYDYAQLQGGNYDKSNDNLHRTNALNDFNKGNSIINFAGQAYYCGAAILDYTDPTGKKHIGDNDAYDKLFWYSDGEASTNGFKLPLVFFATCGAGDFAEGEKPGDDLTWKDKTMEKLITTNTGGAIGVIGSTGSTYRGEDSLGKSDGNWWLDTKFWELFFGGNYQQGSAFFEMKTEYVNDIFLKYNWQQPPYKAALYGYNLQGDPEVSIWTDTPRSLTVLPSGIWVGSHTVTVKVVGITDEPIKNARVCLQNSEVYSYGVTNESGLVDIKVNSTTAGTIDIVVTAHNFLPYEDTLDVTIEPADLTLTSNDITLSNDNPEEFDQITIQATIHNLGETDFTPPATVRFSDGNPTSGGTKIADVTLSESILIGAHKTVQTQWTATGGGNHSIFVQIDPEDAVTESYKNNNQAFKNLIVKQPDLSIFSNDIDIEPSGKVSSTSDITVNAVVHNLGDTDVSNVIVRFFEVNTDDEIQQVGVDKSIASIIKGNSGQTSITFKPQSDAKLITIIVDPDDLVSESDEQNNMANISISVNSPPYFYTIPDLSLDEDSVSLKAIDIDLFVYDADNIMTELEFILEHTNTSNITMNLTTGNELNIIPAANWSGISIVTVNADDGLDQTETSFSVTVDPINDAPILEPLGTVEVNESELVNFTILAYDIDSDTLTFTDNSDLFEIDPDSGLISFVPTTSDIGEYYITIKVTDNHPTRPGVDEEILTLKVVNVPDPPVLNPIETQYATAGEVFTLTVTAADPDSELLLFDDDSHLFDIERRSGKITFLPSEIDAGYEYNITITVSDGMLNDSISFILIISSDTPEKPNETDNDSKTDTVAGVPIAYLIIIILVIIIVVALAGYLIFRKRSDKEELDKFRTGTDDFEVLASEEENEVALIPEVDELPPVPPPTKMKKKVVKKVKPKPK